MTKRAAIYARLSRDHTGAGESVEQQRADARALAAARGWEVVAEYVDGSISAATEGKRPEFARMLEAIRAGGVDAVVGRTWDRMTRNRRDDLAFIEACEAHHVHIAFTRGADIDLSTGPGQMVADILSMVARAEIREKSARQKDANAKHAREGKHFKTHQRPFGYELDGVTVREAEAQAIRDGYDLILSGGSLREVARLWNGRGLVGPQKGQPWTGSVVSRTLRQGRPAGYRTYHGELVRGDDGEPIDAEWPAIVDRDKWRRVQTILTNPERRWKYGNTATSELLLTGVAVCGVCGSKVESGGRIGTTPGPDGKPQGGRTRYRCKPAMGGHIMREAKPVDDFVTDLVVGRLAEPDLVQEFVRPKGPAVDVAALRRKAAEVQARMDDLGADYVAGLVSRGAMVKGTERARAELAQIEAEIPAEDTASAALRSLVTGLDLLRSWEALSLDAKRGVVDALLTVRLLPPKAMRVRAYNYEHGIRTLNPDTVEVTWK